MNNNNDINDRKHRSSLCFAQERGERKVVTDFALDDGNKYKEYVADVEKNALIESSIVFGKRERTREAGEDNDLLQWEEPSRRE